MAQVGGNHGTIAKGGQRLFNKLVQSPHIKKVTVGWTRRRRSGYASGSLSFKQHITGGIILLLHGNDGFTEIMAYCENPQRVMEEFSVQTVKTKGCL